MVRRAGSPAGTTQRGSALVEFAVVLPLLSLLVLGTVDIGRIFRLETRLTNSAREGGAFAQFHPANVNLGCDGAQNVTARVLGEDPGLGALADFRIEALKKDPATGALAAYTGCRTTATVSLAPGDVVVVRVRASFSPLTPFVSALTGSPITVTGSHQVVVQG